MLYPYGGDGRQKGQSHAANNLQNGVKPSEVDIVDAQFPRTLHDVVRGEFIHGNHCGWWVVVGVTDHVANGRILME